jgi:predicted phage-related endonuclease
MKQTSIRRTGVSSSKIDAILNKSKYKNVLEQYLLDTKQIKEELGEVGLQKTNMGKVMEPIIKELVEQKFGITLTVDKERYMHDTYDMFTIEFDALDYVNKTVYEFKNTERDEKSILQTYYGQVQFAMYIIGWDKARICYLRNGWDLGYIDVPRDENYIEHMITAGLYYANCLNNRQEPDIEHVNSISKNINFYRGEANTHKGAGVVLELSNEDIQKLYEWNDLKQKIADLEVEDGVLKSHFSELYGKYSDGTVSYSNVEYEREGGYDVAALMKDHPEIDFRVYKRDNSKYSRQQLRVKKSKESSSLKLTEDLV